MKTVSFIRHAKSSWDSGARKDINRPLNRRGQRDAPFMAKKLHDLGERPDAFVLSPAKRIKETVAPFRDVFKLDEDHILIDNDIYHGSSDDLLDVVHSLPEDWSTIFLFCHNPAITYIAHYFGGTHIDNVPTTGVVKVVSKTDDWASITTGNSKIETFYYPKMYLK